MLRCSQDYNEKSDSLLNVVYNKIRIKLNPEQKGKLKKEQLAWLKKRNVYFNKVYKEVENQLGNTTSQDSRMIIADKEAEFVFKRVEELLKRL